MFRFFNFVAIFVSKLDLVDNLGGQKNSHINYSDLST